MPKKPILLSSDMQESLKAVALATGKTEEQLITEALDQYLSQLEQKRGLDQLLAVAGMWKDRKDLPNVDKRRGF